MTSILQFLEVRPRQDLYIGGADPDVDKLLLTLDNMPHIVQLFEKHGDIPSIRGEYDVLRTLLRDSPFVLGPDLDDDVHFVYTRQPESAEDPFASPATYARLLDFLINKDLELISTTQWDMTSNKRGRGILVYTFDWHC
ncbi:hypothetical protein HDU87_005505 [Geranomyces variabilis]|uniref:Uncharacterized protein n=1 Tax=Geranomyces variabilis TaxID=109894 RepID=A0AAD5XR64_9FUNG|nr:hypothetical protein HDU87_005505 [Geranomyces variabilis]